MPTSRPGHSITETPELAAALAPLRERLGANAPSLSELVRRGAEATLRELRARDRARTQRLSSFVDRLSTAPEPDLDEAHRVRHATRQP